MLRPGTPEVSEQCARALGNLAADGELCSAIADTDFALKGLLAFANDEANHGYAAVSIIAVIETKRLIDWIVGFCVERAAGVRQRGSQPWVR